MSSRQQTLEQRRAEQAWKDVGRVNEGSASLKQKYAALARKMPADIQSSGLGQALAFLRAKTGQHREGNEHWTLYKHISTWVMAEMKRPESEAERMLEWVIQQTSATYRQAATEASRAPTTARVGRPSNVRSPIAESTCGASCNAASAAG